MCEIRTLLRLGDPFSDKKIPKSDPYNTVFIGRLSYQTTEERLRKEFEDFGPIESLRLVRKPDGTSRGYAFCTFRRDRDADYAIKKGDGRRIQGQRIIVDRELGRTKKSWLPKRLGGGKGGESRRAEKVDSLVREVEREMRHEARKKLEKERAQADAMAAIRDQQAS